MCQISAAGLESAVLFTLQWCTADAIALQNNVYNMKPNKINLLYEPGYWFYRKFIKKNKGKILQALTKIRCE